MPILPDLEHFGR